MIRMSFEHINTHPVEQALNKLMNTQLKNLRTSYNVNKIGVEIMREIAERRKEYSLAIKELAEKDEHGNMLFDEAGGPKIPMTMQDKVEEATKKVLAGDVVIERMPVPTLELMEAKLTPNEVAALAPMISGLED